MPEREKAETAAIRARLVIQIREAEEASGGFASGNVTYQLQVAQSDTCSAGSYSAVAPSDGGSDHWEIVNSTYITDGEVTFNISPGLTDPGGGATFESGELRDNNSNTTGNINLSGNYFTEIEFAIQATDNSLDETHYCFRLYDTTGGSPLDNYTYAEAVVVPGRLWLWFAVIPLLPLALRRRQEVGVKEELS